MHSAFLRLQKQDRSLGPRIQDSLLFLSPKMTCTCSPTIIPRLCLSKSKPCLLSLRIWILPFPIEVLMIRHFQALRHSRKTVFLKRYWRHWSCLIPPIHCKVSGYRGRFQSPSETLSQVGVVQPLGQLTACFVTTVLLLLVNHSFTYLSGCYPKTTVEMNGCNRDYNASKPPNIY